MMSARTWATWGTVLLIALASTSCTQPATTVLSPSTAPPSSATPAVSSAGQNGTGTPNDPARVRLAAYQRLLGELETFHVSGGVRTEEGLLLPETIAIEIRSEICVESREPGSRFWALDYDTCFTYVSLDSLDVDGEYEVQVPCLDADRTYESRHSFGDLRLIQRGPVSFLASSDAGWRHQETFTSSRNQRRDLRLNLDTDMFWVVVEGAPFRIRPGEDATALELCPFGTPVGVVRFHQGWAECILGQTIGWMEMRHLGTEEEMKVKKPLLGTPTPQRRPDPELPTEDEP